MSSETGWGLGTLPPKMFNDHDGVIQCYVEFIAALWLVLSDLFPERRVGLLRCDDRGSMIGGQVDPDNPYQTKLDIADAIYQVKISRLGRIDS